MEKRNFYQEIKESIEKYFGFLKEFGFSQFEEVQYAHELHFETKNDFVSIDIYIEATTSTLIWANINNYFIDNLELNNSVIEAYKTAIRENYDDLFEQYLKTKNTILLDKIEDQYIVNGKEINDNYLRELSEILKRHSSTLSGDFELLESNSKFLKKTHEKKVALERVKKGTYTLEYQFMSEVDFDAYQEFDTLKDIKPYLEQRTDIKNYRILDCYMNEVALDV